MQEANQSEFIQKDLMQHLLNVAQHTVTREEIDVRFSKLDDEINTLNNKIDTKSRYLLTTMVALDSVIIGLLIYLR